MNRYSCHMAIFLIFLLFTTSTTWASKESSLCKKILQETGAFDPYGGDEYTKDREQLGELALASGLPYFYVKVPIEKLPLILGSRYLPDLEANELRTAPQTLLRAVNETTIRSPIDATLGGLNVLFGNESKTDRLPTMRKDGSYPRHAIQARVNSNALILYSPRILSLQNWYFGNFAWVGKDSTSEKVVSTICRGWTCLSSSNSRKKIKEDLEAMGSDDRPIREVLRIDGALPSYEIVGILIQPYNETLTRSVMNAVPELSDWAPRFIFSDTFPKLDPSQVPYLKRHLRAVVEDINPSVMSDLHGLRNRNSIAHSTAVFSYSPVFESSVRSILSSGTFDVRNPIRKLGPNGFSGMGVSRHNTNFFEAIGRALDQGGTVYGSDVPQLLPGAKVSAYGRFDVNAVRPWKFHLLEYASDKDSPVTGLRNLVALAITDEGSNHPPADVPHGVWGIGTVDPNNGSIRWIWPESPKQ